MKKLSVLFVTIIFLTSFWSCKNQTSEPESSESVYGIWVEKSWDNTGVQTLARSDAFEKNKYGFKISQDNKFIERKNSGWCGTPPITYADFEGIWKLESGNIVKIKVAYWGGTTTHKMEIISVSNDELRIKYYFED